MASGSRLAQVFNLQRLAVLTASLSAEPLDAAVIWEAMRDKVHQPQREGLVSAYIPSPRVAAVPRRLFASCSFFRCAGFARRHHPFAASGPRGAQGGSRAWGEIKSGGGETGATLRTACTLHALTLKLTSLPSSSPPPLSRHSTQIPGLSKILNTLTPLTHPGLLGVCLSGAGPTILALVDNSGEEPPNKKAGTITAGADEITLGEEKVPEKMRMVGDAIKAIWEADGVSVEWLALEVDNEGATMVEL